MDPSVPVNVNFHFGIPRDSWGPRPHSLGPMDNFDARRFQKSGIAHRASQGLTGLGVWFGSDDCVI